MANDKDFLLKNAVEVGGSTKVTLGTVTANNVDLSTGNYFADTPSGTSTYTFSNAGDVQSFQIEVTGGTAEVAQNFSTTLYTGGSTTLNIDLGIDLAAEDGLTWIKCRNAAEDHFLFSSLQNGSGQTLFLETNTTGAAIATNNVSQTSTGFSIPGGDGQINQTGNTYVSWTFKKEPSFFDVVTWTGDGVAGRTVSHNLGTDVGALIVKKTSGVDNWFVWHRGLTDATYRIILNLTSGEQQQTNAWNSTAPTSTEFTLGDNANVNESGATYVAYLFAHDIAADGLIQCGSYTGTGSYSSPPVVNLGWSPSWIMIKRADGIASWQIYDTTRGATQDSSAYLRPDQAQAEQTYTGGYVGFYPTSTGFSLSIDGNEGNASGSTYIYIAIRAASDPDITWPASVEWTGGTAPSSPAVGETDVYTFITDDGGTSYVGIQSADNLS